MSDRIETVIAEALSDGEVTALEYDHLIGPGRYALRGAREALKPIREEFVHLQRFASDLGSNSDLGRGLQYALDGIAPLIYTTEELS